MTTKWTDGIQWRIKGKARDIPFQSKFFHFYAVFGEAIAEEKVGTPPYGVGVLL